MSVSSQPTTPVTLVIGVAGGVASGKSLVTDCFGHFGAAVIDADRAGHEVLLQAEVQAAIVDRWGAEMLRDGTIDRSRLAQIVFADNPQAAGELEHLEQLTHPAIGRRLEQQLADFRQQQRPAVVLDAPVMFKAGWQRLCDQIVFVDAPRTLRLQRAQERGWSADELDRREARQAPLELKRAQATACIDNSQSKAHTYQQAVQLWIGWGLSLSASRTSPSSLFQD